MKSLSFNQKGKKSILKAIIIFAIIVIVLSTVWILKEKRKSNSEITAISQAEVNRKLVEEEYDGFEMELLLYDSAVGDGRDILNEDIWNATTNATRTVTIQVNLKNEDVKKDYNPGELTIRIDNLGVVCPQNSTGTTFLKARTVSGDLATSTEKEYEWSYSYDEENNQYILTNNNLIYADTSFETTVQLVYSLEANKILNNSDITIKAIINDSIPSLNSIHFAFTSTEKNASASLTATKLVSFDSLPEDCDDYIWVKYGYSANTNTTTNVRGMVYDEYIKTEVPEGCIMLNSSLQEVTIDESREYILKTNQATTNTSGYCYYPTYYFYIGYPKATYEDETVENYISWYGKIKESYYYVGVEKEVSLLATSTKSVNLSEFEIDFEGELYSVSKLNNSSRTAKRSYNRIINSEYGENLGFYIYQNAIYYGSIYDIALGDDLLYISGADGEYRRLGDDEYYFKSITYNPTYFKNGNGIVWQYNKYTFKLFVRQAGSDEYVQYGDDLVNSSGSKTITFQSTDRVVGWYFEFYDLQESMFTDSNSISTSVYVQTSNNINTSGRIYNFDYMKVYVKDDDGNRTLRNAATLENYNNAISEELAENDLDLHGSYIQRAFDYHSYFEQDYENLTLNASITNISKNRNCFYRDYNIYPSISNTTTTCAGAENFNGYRLYIMIPQGMEIIDSTEDILNNISYSGYSCLKRADGSKFTLSEYREFIKDRTSIDIIENYKGTTNTCIQITINYEDEPFNTYYSSGTLENFKISTRIPIDSYYLYGGSYSIVSYLMFLKENEEYLPYSSYTDSTDIDNDGSTTDFYLRTVSNPTSIYLLISSYQEIVKQVKTAHTNDEYVSGTALIESGEEYSYKLRIKTGLNSITNLVIYDNIENQVAESWKGTFNGIDISAAESTGNNIKVYYSTELNVGTLEENPTLWQEYDDSIDKSTVKSIAFDFQDSVISANKVTYVEIKMKAPDVIDTVQTVRNRFKTVWNALGPTGEIIDNVVGISSNIDTLAIKGAKDNIKVRKEWLDNDDELGFRPDEVNVDFYQNDTKIDTITLNEGNNWEHTFLDLPVFDGDDNAYTYSVQEADVNLYYSKIEEDFNDSTVNKTFIIKNSLKNEIYTNIVGVKKWEDDGNLRKRRPDSITINLLRDGVKVATTTANKDDNWKYEFNDVLLYKNKDEKYVYTVEEEISQYYENNIEYDDSYIYEGLQITFGPNCYMETSYDYMEMYYKKNGKTYKVGYWTGDSLKNAVVTIPSMDFYIYLRTDLSVVKYGFDIVKMEPIRTATLKTFTISTLPSYDNLLELEGDNYPETDHNYGNHMSQMWYYSYGNTSNSLKIADITNTYKKIPSSVLVHHYFEGTEDRVSEDELIEGLVWDSYTTSPAEGLPVYYELAQTPSNATGEFKDTQEEVIYYYKYKKYNYNVEYYYDGIKDDSKTETIEATYNDNIEDYIEKNITGYRLMTQEEGNDLGITDTENGVSGLPLRITEEEDNNLIKVYYVKDQFDYTVEYYYDAIKDDSKTETIEATYQDVIDRYDEKLIPGYRLMTEEEGWYRGVFGINNGTIGLPLTITENPDNNIIKVYYIKDQYDYTVEYYYDGIKDDSKTETKPETYEEIIDDYTDKVIAGYKLDRVEGKPLTISEDPANNIMRIYYVKDSFGYTIEYYYDNVKDDSKTETGTATYQDVIDRYDEKLIPGYRLMTDEEGWYKGVFGLVDGVLGLPLTISENPDDNVIRVYYVKDQFDYTVEYYYSNIKDDTKTVTDTATYGETINNYTDKVTTGYKLDRVEGKPLTISDNPANNVMKVYYIIDDTQTKEISYNVEYYKDGTKADTDTVTNTVQVLAEETLTVNKLEINTTNKYVGYKLEKTEPNTIPDTIANGGVIKVYYVKDSFGYSVEYYYDGTIDNSKTETGTGEYQSTINDYTDKVITGYKLDKVEGKPITISENPANNVMKVYYVKDNFGYSIEYYYDGTIDNSKTVTDTAVYGETIDTYTDKVITGYKLDRVEGKPLTISENPANNVMRVYYVKDNFGYSIEYYYDNIKDDSKTVTDTATYGATINDYTDKVITGYKLDKAEGKPITISENPANNVMKVYYVKDILGYTVEYYYDNVKDDSKTVNDAETYGATIVDYTDKVIPGYKLDKVEGNPLTISENPANNVMKVYYVKDSFAYSVEYYYDDVKDDSKTETDTATYQEVISTYTDKNIPGYRLMTEEEGWYKGIFGIVDGVLGLPLTITENPANNVIKVYYVKDSFNYTVEYYYDGTKDDSKTETKPATYQDTINGYDDKNITGYKLDKVEGTPLTISENPANNVMKVYYVKDRFAYSVEYYYDDVKDDSKTETDTATYQEVISTYTDKNIPGYRLMTEEEGWYRGIFGLVDGVLGLPLTISENADNNVIRVYYVKDSFAYSIEYYYDGTIDNSKTESGTEEYQSTINDYTDKVIPGYKLDRVEGKPITISENPSNNIMKVYYVKDNFGYSIEYYYDGTIDNSKTETGTGEYQSTINDYTDKVIPGYKLDKVEGKPLTITENTANNIMKVYYIIDNGQTKEISYKVEYYKDGTKEDEDIEKTSIQLLDPEILTVNKANINMTDKYIGYKFEKIEPNIIPDTIANGGVIKVYYVKDNFGYTVEYYYDGTKDDSKTETDTAIYESTINDYTDKVIPGYKLDRVEGKPITISENPANNIMKVYYVKDNFSYSIEYYYDGTIDNSKTETGTGEYQSTINDYTDKVITGYKFDRVEGKPITISENPDNNVMKVYYVKDGFGYTIEYYYDGTKDDSKTETDTATYGDTIDTYTDKVITGYKLDKVEGRPLTISANPDNNVMKVYYVKDNFGYSIEYYYDGTIDNIKTETDTATYGDTIDTYTDKVITGYKLDKVEGKPITISENPDNNVMKVYYVKDNFGYNIEYYYDGTIDNSKTETDTATYGDTIDTYTDKVITGYKLDRVEGKPITISENPDNNVMKVYYVKDGFGYSIEYYYDGTIDNSKTETDTATYGDTIDTYTDKVITGYKLDKVEGRPITISEDSDNNVMKVYYVKDDFGYSIEYYYDGTIDNSKTETDTATYGDTIDTYTDKVITGYKLDRVEGKPITISENPANNVMKVYYVIDNGQTKEISYTVEYYKDGTKEDEDVEKTSIQLLAPEILTVNKTNINMTDKYVGYKLEKTEPNTIPDTIANGGVIKVYYVKDSFDYTIEYYYDNAKDDSKTETGTAEYQSTINDYTGKVIPGYKLDKVEGKPITISEDPANNVMKVYYVKDNFGYSIEYYYDGTKDDSKTETDTATYGETINDYTDKVITGYKLDKVEGKPITISEDSANNVMKVYYVKDNFGYSKEYYYDGTIDNSKTETDTATYGDTIDTYTDKVIPGYKLDKVEGKPITISENPDNNVMKVYYVKDNFRYSIEYYYDGTIDNSKTETDTATYGDTIDTYTDKVITGYKLDKVEGKPITISEDSANNVMKVYYVKDNFGYTVEYYYDGTKDNTKTETDTATYGDTIDTYTDKVIPGYKLDKVEGKPITISENPDNNVMKVYYVKDNFEYTVEYYYDNVKDDSKTVTDTATYQEVISTYTDKNIPGYRLMTEEEGWYKGVFGLVDGVLGLPLTISENTANNVIKVYYVKDSFGYTIEYYYDGTKDDSKTITGTGTYQDVINDYTDKVIPGYKLDKVEGRPIIINEDSANNVMKVYYVKDDFGYTIEYYYDNVKDDSKTETDTATYGDTIDTYTDKVITGYKLDKIEGKPLTVTENVDNNIMKIYYVKDQFDYSIEYYYDGTKDDSKTITGTGTYQDVIDDYADKVIPGYKLDRVEGKPITISENPDNNVMKVYYIKDNFNYTIEYYYDGTKDDSKTVREIGTYQDVIRTYTDKNIPGYRLMTEEEGWYKGVFGLVDGVLGLPLTISENPDNNVVKVYYVKDTFDYTVEYYYDGTKDDSKTETDTATYQDVIDDYTDKVITGYKLDRVEGKPLTISENPDNNVIKVYYIKDNFNYTVEYYYSDTKDDSKTETGTATYQDIIDTYTDKVILGYKFDRVEGSPLTISANPNNNKIKVYYIIDDEQTKEISYTVEYYEDGIKIDGDTQVVKNTVQVLAEETLTVDKTAINTTDKYPGYKLDKTEPNIIPDTIANGETIKVYYIKNQFNYTVEYYYDNVRDDSKTETKIATYQDIIRTYTDKNIEGYKLEKTENYPLTITRNESENVIKVYYVIDEDNKKEVSYTIIYYVEGEEKDSVTITKEVQILQPDIVTVDKNLIDKNKYESCYFVGTDPEEVPDTIEDGGIIKVYYEYKITSVIVKYVDKISREEISERVVLTGKYGTSYDISEYEKEIDGYVLTEKPEETTGTFDIDTKVYTYYYQKEAKVIVKYLEEAIDESEEEIELAEKDIIEGYEGKDYITEPKEIEDCIYIRIEGNPEGRMDAGIQEVKYYYIQRAIITVNHIDIDTEEVMKKDTVNGTVGSNYVVKPKDFENYVVAPEDKEGNEILHEEIEVIMTKEETIVNYYYKKASAGVLEKHINIKNGELLDNKLHEGDVGDPYTTELEEFEGYDVITDKQYFENYVKEHPEILEENEVTTVDELLEKLGINAEDNYIPENAEGEMAEELIVVNYYYIKRAKVVVKYVDVNTEEEIANKEEIEGQEGDTCKTEEKEIEDYYIVEKLYPEKTEIVMDDGQILVVYYYAKKSAGVIEEHIDRVSNEIIETEEHEGLVGDAYEITSREYEGYDLLEEDEEEKSLLPENAKGTMTEELIVVRYYYARRATVKVEYIDENTDEILYEEKTTEDGKKEKVETTEYIRGHEGDEYLTWAKDIKEYVLNENRMPENGEGEMRVEEQEDGTFNTEIVVKYYYRHISAGVVEEHRYIKTKELLEEKKYSGNEGDSYKTSPRTYEKYVLVEKDSEGKNMLPENAEGKMQIEEIKVTYYYARKASVRVEYLDNTSKAKVAEDLLIVGKEDDGYKVEAKEIAGYKVVESKLPENAKGTMRIDKEGEKEVTEIVVTYYYEKVVEPAKEEPKSEPIVPKEERRIIIGSAPTKTTIVVKDNGEVREEVIEVTPKTGDMIPVIAISIIGIVILANIVQITVKKHKDKKE